MVLLAGLALVFNVVMALIAIALATRYWQHLAAKRKMAHIPGFTQFVPILPFRIPFLQRVDFATIHRNVLDRINKYGDGSMMSLVYSNRCSVSICDPEIIKYITTKNAKNFPKPVKLYEILQQLGPNILTTNGDEWLKHRKIVNPVFTDNHMRLVADATIEASNRMLQKWQSLLESNNGILEVDISKAMSDITLEVIGTAGFGYDLRAIENDQPIDRRIHTMTFRDVLMRNLNLFILKRFTPQFLWRLLPIFENPNQELNLYLDDIIKQRLDLIAAGEGHQHHDLLSLLLRASLDEGDNDNASDGGAASNNNNNNKLTHMELKSDMLIFLFAGHDTTSATLTWALYELARHPELQEKEIDEVIGRDREPAYDDIPNLVYTTAVIEETLRLHTPVANLLKQTVEEDVIGSYRVPPKTTVVIQLYALHHNEKYWKAPYDFIPGRFDPRDEQEYVKGKMHPYQFIPFAIGARGCVGARFSMTEARLLLAKMIQQFTVHVPAQFESDPKKFQVQEAPGIVLKPNGGMHLVLKQRR